MLREKHRSREQYTSSWLSLDNSGNTSSCNLFPLHPINSSFTGQSVTTAASQIKPSGGWAEREEKLEGEDVLRRVEGMKTKRIKVYMWEESAWKIGLCSLLHEDVRMCYGAMFVMVARSPIARPAPLQPVSCSLSKQCQTRFIPWLQELRSTSSWMCLCHTT